MIYCKEKFNFISKYTKLIDKIAPLNLQKFSPVKLVLTGLIIFAIYCKIKSNLK